MIRPLLFDCRRRHLHQGLHAIMEDEARVDARGDKGPLPIRVRSRHAGGGRVVTLALPGLVDLM